MTRRRIFLVLLGLAVAAGVGGLTLWESGNRGVVLPWRAPEVGEILDSHRDVPIYYNGKMAYQSHGSHSSADGYYYGKTWQCVEYVKRFYFDAKGHRMPNVWGNARDFFNPDVPHGELNADRNLLQFSNGGDSAPQVDDLVVFRYGSYGHVAIVSGVGEDYVEMVQQNVGTTARDRWTLVRQGDNFQIGGSNPPAGWLRLQ